VSYAIPVHVALVDDTKAIDHAQLVEVAGALNEQVQADFAPKWHVRATVGVYDEVPPNTWGIHIQSKLDEPGALGYHTDQNHVPISYVMITDGWPATVSHELLEMLADPWGSRLHRAGLPAGLEDQAQSLGLRTQHSYVHYLLEVCDPCEATSYEVGGVQLSDFLLPSWYRTNPALHPAYSFASGCQFAREVSDGGYVSFCVGNHWYQVFNQQGKLNLSDLGVFDGSTATLREWTDRKAREFRA
jgi:hypothetical protein